MTQKTKPLLIMMRMIVLRGVPKDAVDVDHIADGEKVDGVVPTAVARVIAEVTVAMDTATTMEEVGVGVTAVMEVATAQMEEEGDTILMATTIMEMETGATAAMEAGEAATAAMEEGGEEGEGTTITIATVDMEVIEVTAAS